MPQQDNIPVQPQQPFGPPQANAAVQPQPGAAPVSVPQAIIQPQQPGVFSGSAQQPAQAYPGQPAAPAAAPYQPTAEPVAPAAYPVQAAPAAKFGVKKIGLIAAVVAAVLIGGFAVLKLSGKAADVVKTGSLSGGVKLSEYTSPEFGFSMKTPDGWTAEVKNEESVQNVTFAEPAGDLNDKSEASSNYARLKVEQEDSADKSFVQKEEAKYFDDLKNNLKAGLADQNTKEANSQIGTVESEEMITIAGLNAYKVRIKISNFGFKTGATGYEYAVFVYESKTKQYEITLNAHESEEDVLGKADEIIGSFKKS